MTQPVYYCKSWFRARKKPTELWPAEKAEAAHRNRLPYTALVGSADQPYCFVNVADKVIGIGFLDSLLRESLTYAFKEVEAGKLFLTMAIHREFENDTDQVACGATYVFDQSGVVHIRREFFKPHRFETATSAFDPAPNLAVWPDFGAYDHLIHAERR
nr:lytic transglycosylase [Massilia sp. PDC64]